MMLKLTYFSVMVLLISSCGGHNNVCNDKACQSAIACKLTSPELRKRKETVVASLKTQVQETKELPNGYSFRFLATDTMSDKLRNFIKTEKECCEFFDFKLRETDDNKFVWLELTGPEGTKEFIKTELEL